MASTDQAPVPPDQAVREVAALVLAQPAQAGQVDADALVTLLRGLPEPLVQVLRNVLRQDGPPDPAVVQDALLRLQASLARRPDLPQAAGDAVAQLVKNLIRTPEAPVRSFQAPQGQPSAPATTATAHAALPESWEAWMKAGVKALTDASVSPREAPFHAAQAKEGTAFFELPLPWSPNSPLQMWVEADRQGKGGEAKGGGSTRVLLGLSFSRLGETRLGLAKGPEGLQVRVWAEHPEALTGAQAGMEEELKTLGMPVDLKILPLDPGPEGTVPTIRSLAVGSTFQVLG